MTADIEQARAIHALLGEHGDLVRHIRAECEKAPIEFKQVQVWLNEVQASAQLKPQHVNWRVEPDPSVYDRLDPYWIDFELVLVPQLRQWKWRMWADHGLEFFIHPAMDAAPNTSFPEFFRHDRDGHPRGLVRIVRDKK